MVDDPREAIDALAAWDGAFVIGVRHHSPVLSAAIPALLSAAAPDRVLVELPDEMQPWLEWLAHPDTAAPVALAAAYERDDEPLAFYPFADFSPELAALRWARAAGVPAECCDLPLADRAWTDRGDPTPARPEAGRTLAQTVATALTGRGDDDLWDRWVEAQAPGSPPEAVRRAALAAGWTMRQDALTGGGVPALDLRREAWMRQRIGGSAGRVALVVGAFHAPALIDGELAGAPVPVPKREAPVLSLVPYTFELLDARSGYPAGIRDPRWQQAVLEGGAEPEAMRASTHEIAVRVARALRADGHQAGPAEGAEISRIAGDLARLRNLPAPGRGELVEALQTVLAQGEPVGRGRAVARAMQQELVGDRRGAIAPAAPACGLEPEVRGYVATLKLPGPGDPGKAMRLDPLRSPLDRARDLLLHRLDACGIRYAEADPTMGVAGADTLTTMWRMRWTPATDAALAVASRYGVTLAQATAGMLSRRRAAEVAEGGPSAAQAVAGLATAAACGLRIACAERLADVATAVVHGGTLREILAAISVLRTIDHGHYPGITEPLTGADEVRDDLFASCVAAVEAIAGSDDVNDARALLDLVGFADESGRLMRLGHTVRALTATGSPLMRGAAGAAGVLLRLTEPEEFGERLASWAGLDGNECTQRMRGALVVAGALLQAGGETLAPLLDTIDSLDDDEFVARLPALRGGFDAVTPADRDRLLATVAERHGEIDATLTTDAATLGRWLTIDRAGLAALDALGLTPAAPAPSAPPASEAASAGEAAEPPEQAHSEAAAGEAAAPGEAVTGGEASEAEPAEKRREAPGATAHGIAPAERWRLLLGRERQRLSGGAGRLATALDELYGAGRGEGAHSADGGPRGGREAAFPSTREWADELEALFGSAVRDEVLARAAVGGRPDALLHVDPDHVVPSMDLLHTVLTLAGGLPESRLARLRPLAARLIADLTAQLARRLRPALTGLSTPRPTRRPTGRLDLARTVRANLATAYTTDGGRVTIVPERPVFRSRGRRSVDWQVILVVDVSGSMETSTIWAALTAAVIAGVPSLRTHFVTFSTEVIDMTDRVTDPLSLLLEVKVGGGTHIAAGLRYARQLVTTPSRAMVVLISDFEEGYPLGGLLGAVRALVNDGVKVLGCASLDDRGAPRYSAGIAAQLVAAGMPVAALSPTELARWIGEQVR